jgi:hypothetical protein
MNEQTLDRVARALATRQPRRTVVKAAAAAIAGGALTVVVRHEDAAAGKRLRRCCRQKKQEAVQFCLDNGKPGCTTLVDFFCARARTGPDICIFEAACGKPDGSFCPVS